MGSHEVGGKARMGRETQESPSGDSRTETADCRPGSHRLRQLAWEEGTPRGECRWSMIGSHGALAAAV